jgi:hypothetical protein
MGTHALAGHYSSKKAFIEGTFAKLDLVLPQGAQLCRASSRESGSAADVKRLTGCRRQVSEARHAAVRTSPRQHVAFIIDTGTFMGKL